MTLWIDDYQGNDADGSAFGFVGSHSTGPYCGWFFTYPSEDPEVHNEAELQSVIDSLEQDSEGPREPVLPLALVQQFLRSHLESTLAS